MMRSDQEIPFPRTQDLRVPKTWGGGGCQRVEKAGQGETGWEGGDNKARKVSDWLPLSFFKRGTKPSEGETAGGVRVRAQRSTS